MRSTVLALAAGSALIGALGACVSEREAPEASASAEAVLALPFVENDFPAALARAREAELPLFVEVWAPW